MKRADIQGLRGLSVLLVVLYHAHLPLLSGGYVGVDIFFVISGYLITGLIVDELSTTGRLDLVQFYARRVRRLLPAASLVLSATLLAGWLLYSPLERRGLSASAIATAVYVSNVWFALRATDYFSGGAATNPLLHTWSLGVEEQFYLAWPVLLLVVTRLRGRSHVRNRIVAVITAVTVMSFVACVVITEQSQPWAFFGSPPRAWEFGAGALTRLLVLSDSARWRSLFAGVGAVGIALMVGAAMTFSQESRFPGVIAFVPVLGSALTLASGQVAPGCLASRVLSTPLWVRLGDLSYSWYLWHWPVFVFLESEYGRLTAGTATLGVFGSLVLAELGYRVVENPVRFWPPLVQRPLVSIAMGIGLSIGCVALGILSQAETDRETRKAGFASYAEAMDTRAIVYGGGCHADYSETSPPPCRFGVSDAEHVVVLYGDSHAAHWFPALDKIAREQRWQLISLTKSSCPSVVVEPYLPQFNRLYHECTEWRRNMMDRILKLRPMLVIAADSSRYVDAVGGESVYRLSASEWKSGLEILLDTFGRAGIPVAVMHDTPWADSSLPICLSRARWRGRDPIRECSFEPDDGRRALLAFIEKESLKTRPSARLIDLSSSICPTTPCEPVQDGLVLYADGNHLATQFSESLSPALLRDLRGAFPTLPRGSPGFD